MKIIKNQLVKNSKGFTILEVVLTVFLVSVVMLVLFTIIAEMNEADRKSKEMNYVEQLIEPYISYYKNVEVTNDNLDAFLSDVGEVNLVKEARSYNIASVPNNFRNLDLICENKPELIKDDKGKNEYIKFVISCEKDGNKINRGNNFIVIRYIN